MTMQIKGKAREASISAVIIRADGTRVDLGTVSYWHRNPLKRLAWRVRCWLKG
jgi:hypothetical protein